MSFSSIASMLSAAQESGQPLYAVIRDADAEVAAVARRLVSQTSDVPTGIEIERRPQVALQQSSP